VCRAGRCACLTACQAGTTARATHRRTPTRNVASKQAMTKASLSLAALVVVSASIAAQQRPPVFELALVDRAGALVRVGKLPPGTFAVRLSPDGHRVAFDTYDGAIWTADLANIAVPRRFGAGRFPMWSADGARILFAGADGMRLYWQAADGSSPAELLFSAPGHDVSEGVLSPDGRTLVARVTDARGDQIVWSHPLEGDTASRVLVRSDGLGPRVSPDGRWLAYASEESGGLQVYVAPLEGPQARYQVSTDGGYSPLWSPDGRQLMYAKGQQVVAASIVFAPAFEVTNRQTLFDGSFEFNPSHASFDVSPDGKQFLLPKSQGANARMIVVYNWREELASAVRSAQH